jgi:alpha-N-arabinofuranosidase
MLKYLRLNKFFFLLFFFFSFPLLAQNKNEFYNPILAGFYPDPSICRVGDNYYLVNSTFAYFPGITIFQSKDLVDWRLIGYALDKPEQLNLDSAGVSRGLFAPAIRYNKGIFYITCTLVDKGGNFVVTAKNPAGPWSNPVWLPQINGIDPSLFFDDNGKAYITYNSIPPGNKPLYEGHRTIRIYEFDYDSLKVKGEEHILINGGTDIKKKPVWIEAPHIFKKNDYYYLICAEGGTAYNHSEVVFRSKNVEGPYISYQNNPILTQRNLDPNRSFPITSTGHADFVEVPSNKQHGAKTNWWAVFLGCQPYSPYKEDYYNLGRETFLAPVKWENSWPVITSDHEVVKWKYPAPLPKIKNFQDIPHSGNFEYTDNFDSDSLNLNWQFLRTPWEKWYDLTSRKGFLSMQLRPETCSGNMNPSFLARRQQHNFSSASIGMDFLPESENEKSGLLIFQNETHYYFICKSIEKNQPVIQLLKSVNNDSSFNKMKLLESIKISKEENDKEVYFKIESHGATYSFWYGFAPQKWNLLKDGVDGKFLSTKVAGGFVGCMYALYSTSLGKSSQNKSYFDWFKYSGENEAYK